MIYFDESNEKFSEFLKENPGYGYLKVRTSMASEAMPLKGVHILVSLTYKDEDIIFFDGFTNESGIVEKIKLPTPILDDNNLIKPKKITYVVTVEYKDFISSYNISMYEGVCTNQNINIPFEVANGY